MIYLLFQIVILAHDFRFELSDSIILFICLFHSKTSAKQETVALVIISFSSLKVTFFIQNGGNDKGINGFTSPAAKDNTRNFAHARNVVI
jgi:hypothetical protein